MAMYQPILSNDPYSNMENGGNDNQMTNTASMQMYGRGSTWQAEADRIKHFKVKHGIPMPPTPSFRPRLCIRWLITVGIFWYLLYQICIAATEQRTIILKDTKFVELHMQNCDMHVVKTSLDPLVTVQHWRFLGGVNHDFEDDHTKVILTVKNRMRLPMFRCLATMSVPDDFAFEHLKAIMTGQELSRVVLDSSPAKHVNVTFNEGYLEAKKLPETMYVTAQLGKIELTPPANTHSHVHVQTKHAILKVSTPSPMAATFHGHARDFSIISGPSITESGADVVIGDSNDTHPPLHVIVDSEFDCASYFEVATGKSDVVVKRGVEQERKTPYLTNTSIKRIERLSDWMTDLASTNSPWVARIRLEGPSASKGTWQAMSSEAFLAIPLELLILLSAGSLKPAMKDTTVQLLSTPEEYWSHGELHNDPEDEGMWEIFHVIEPYLNVVEGKSIAWVPNHGQPIIFNQNRGEKWNAHFIDVFKKQTFLFFLAFVLNVVASCSVAMALVVFLTRNINAMSHLNEDDLSISSSQRTYRQAISSTGWRVMATQIDWPEHAVLLRWRKQTGLQLATYFWVNAEAIGANGEEHKVVVERVRASRVPAMRDHSVILEFLFHIRAVTNAIGAESPHAALRYRHSYRFQVEGWDDDVNLISSSEYSNEVYITPRTSVVTLPFLVLKTFFPVPTSSLAFFLDNYAQKYIEGKIPQQIVILSDMTVTYHKNFRDFPECNSLFYVSGYMGRKDRDHLECKRRTQEGRCITYGRTEDFQPPWRCTASELAIQAALGPEEDDKEEHRTQNIPGQLTLGSVDRECREVTFNLRLSQSDDDVAEGALTWDDLM
jgi:hypothetical protein